MEEHRRPTLLALAALGVVAAGAGLEGAVVPGLGAPVLVGAILLAGWVTLPGASAPGTATRLGLGLLGLSLLWAVLPIPWEVRAVLAPGQAVQLAAAEPRTSGDLDAWLAALTSFDIDATLGLGEWTYDPLSGVEGHPTLPGGIAPERLGWALAQLGAWFAMYRVGTELGRSEGASRAFLVGLLLLSVLEALFGLANRNGPSTGIGVKEFYLGSATGTFINRGHLGAFLVLGLASAWGLAAGLFPLEAEEVARHRRHRRRSSQPPSWWEAAGDRIPRLFLLALAAGVVGVGIVACQSRGPILGFGIAAVGVAGFAAARRGERFHLGIGLGVPLAVGVVSLVGFGVRGAFGRFGEIATGGGESFDARVRLWREGLLALKDAPLFGAGPGGWRAAWGPHEAGAHLYDVVHAHSEPLEQLVEVGVVGTLGFVILLAAWGSAVYRGVVATPHEPRFAAGVGALVGSLAVLLQSLGDFPLHTPGVALAAFACAGLARTALHDEPRGASAVIPRWAVLGVCFVTGLLATDAGRLDSALDLTRAQRTGELSRAWYLIHGEAPDAAGQQARRDLASEAAARAPLDPWGQALLAQEEARLAWYFDRDGGPVEDAAFAADLAIHRALRLRPRDGRIDLVLARAMLRLSTVLASPDAWRARAADRLAHAVSLDPWRAPEAYELAETLSDATLERIAAGAPAEGKLAALVGDEYGQALARRGTRDEAVVAFRGAVAKDAGYGPAWFHLGVELRAAEDNAGAAAAFRAFVAARERPGGMEGWALVYLGELEAADGQFRRVLASGPANRWAWEGLAEAARLRGDVPAEIYAWRHLRDLGDPRAAARVVALEAQGAVAPR